MHAIRIFLVGTGLAFVTLAATALPGVAASSDGAEVVKGDGYHSANNTVLTPSGIASDSYAAKYGSPTTNIDGTTVHRLIKDYDPNGSQIFQMKDTEWHMPELGCRVFGTSVIANYQPVADVSNWQRVDNRCDFAGNP